MAINAQFKTAVTALVANVKSGNNFWNSIALFANEHYGKGLEEAFRINEIDAESSIKGLAGIRLQTLGAYRSAKSVIRSANKLNIKVVVDGKVRGKTEVEQDIKSQKQDKPALDKFRTSMTTATTLADGVETSEELGQAFMLAKALTDKLQTKLTEARKQEQNT